MLEITDDLDDCVSKQSELFQHVADAHAEAVAQRDAAELELEELQADADRRFREKAERDEEKVTEPLLKQRVKILPEIKAANRHYLELKARVNKWEALRKSFSQRSYMLRALVDLYSSRVHSSGAISGAKSNMAEASRRILAEKREERVRHQQKEQKSKWS